jgi:hypothetical protein
MSTPLDEPVEQLPASVDARPRPRAVRFKDMTMTARAALIALRLVECTCCVAAWASPTLASFLQLFAILIAAWFVQHKLRTWPAARRADAGES